MAKVINYIDITLTDDDTSFSRVVFSFVNSIRASLSVAVAKIQ